PPESFAALPGAVPAPSETRAHRSLKKTAQKKPVQHSLPLEPAPPVEPRQGARASRLWLCLHFPLLPLEASGSSRAPCAVFEEGVGVRRILRTDKVAGAAGIVAGLSANAALALSPELTLLERNQLREVRTLRAPAVRMERYTSTVSLAPPALL